MLRKLILSAALLSVPVISQAATFSYSNISAGLSYDAVLLSVPADRTVTSGSPNAALSIGPIGLSGASTGNRIFAGEVGGTLRKTLQSTGFAFSMTNLTEAECVDNPTTGSCPPEASSKATLYFEFEVDADQTLDLTGFWNGSDGGGLSLVDFFYFELSRFTANVFNPEELVLIDTNNAANTSDSGTVNESIDLFAGERYYLTVTNAVSAEASNAFPLVRDTGALSFTMGDTVAVPGPAGLPLLAGALGALVLVRRKRPLRRG
jgi:hypothetical protein